MPESRISMVTVGKTTGRSHLELENILMSINCSDIQREGSDTTIPVRCLYPLDLYIRGLTNHRSSSEKTKYQT